MYRVRTSFGNIQGAPYLNTAYWVDLDPADAVAAQAAVDHMRDFWTAMNSNMAAGMSWSVSGNVDVIEALTGNLLSSFSVTQRSGSGTAAGTIAPTSVQGLLRLRSTTFLGGRRVQGHWNIPGVVNGAIGTGGGPLAAYNTALNAAAATLVASSDPALVIWSKRNGSVGSALSGTAATFFAVLRSRRD